MVRLAQVEVKNGGPGMAKTLEEGKLAPPTTKV